MLKTSLGATAKRVPTGLLPNWVLRMVAAFDPTVRQIVPELGKHKDASNEKAIRMLGWKPRSVEESVVATGQSLLQLGLLKGSAVKAGH